MNYKRIDDNIILRIDRDEEIIETILKIIEKENIKLGEINGLGAVKEATIGAYDLEKQAYFKKDFYGTYEISSLHGNITTMDEKPYLHLHIVLGGRNGETVSGHLNRAVIGITSEIIIRIIPGEINRKNDEVTGINILDL